LRGIGQRVREAVHHIASLTADLAQARQDNETHVNKILLMGRKLDAADQEIASYQAQLKDWYGKLQKADAAVVVAEQARDEALKETARLTGVVVSFDADLLVAVDKAARTALLEAAEKVKHMFDAAPKAYPTASNDYMNGFRDALVELGAWLKGHP
jgi:ABC-type transporter Mla subunit MlaD